MPGRAFCEFSPLIRGGKVAARARGRKPGDRTREGALEDRAHGTVPATTGTGGERVGHELAARWRAGERAAFEELARDHLPGILALTSRRAATPARARELALQVLVRAYEGRAALPADVSFRTWVYRIALRLVEREPAPGKGRAERAGAEDGAPRGEPGGAGELALSLARLPARPRAAVELHLLDGLPLADVAAILGRSEAGARRALAEGQRRLGPVAEQLAPRAGEDVEHDVGLAEELGRRLDAADRSRRPPQAATRALQIAALTAGLAALVLGVRWLYAALEPVRDGEFGRVARLERHADELAAAAVEREVRERLALTRVELPADIELMDRFVLARLAVALDEQLGLEADPGPELADGPRRDAYEVAEDITDPDTLRRLATELEQGD